jgi:hypothetical protein
MAHARFSIPTDRNPKFFATTGKSRKLETAHPAIRQPEGHAPPPEHFAPKRLVNAKAAPQGL